VACVCWHKIAYVIVNFFFLFSFDGVRLKRSAHCLCYLRVLYQRSAMR